MKRRVDVSVLLAAAAVAAACAAPPEDRVRVVDVLERAAAAEKNPASGLFEVADFSCGHQPRTALGVPPESRVIWQLALPARGVLHTAVAVEGAPGSAVMFRVGISDDRIYEPLASIDVTADACGQGWTPLVVDLSRYAGRKFSLFYQPNRRQWRLVLGTNRRGGGPDRAYWARPAIETDTAAAKDYFTRLRSKRPQ